MSETQEIAARLEAKGHEIARSIAEEIGMLLWVKEILGMPADELERYTKIAGDMAKVGGVIAFVITCLSELTHKPPADAKRGE